MSTDNPRAPFPIKGIRKVRPDFTITEVDLEGVHASGFTLVWATRSAGFGTTTFREAAGNVDCDNETMGLDVVRDALTKYLEGKPETAWPALLRKYKGIDALLDAATPQRPWAAARAESTPRAQDLGR